MNVLIVSFYSPPANNVAADRISGYLKFLPQENINVYLISRHFDEKLLNITDMNVGQADAGIEEDFVTKGPYIYTNFTVSNTRRSISKWLPPLIKGFYNLKKTDIYHYGWHNYFFKAFNALIKEVNIDMVILSHGPPVILLLAHEISVKYKLKTVVEFRDAYVNESDLGYYRKIKIGNQNRLLKHTKAFIFAQEGARDYFYRNADKALAKIPGFVLHHGFDEAQLKGSIQSEDEPVVQIFNNFRKKKKVLAIFPGTLYNGQDMEFFIEVMTEMAKESPDLFGICLLGTYFDNRQPLTSTQNLLVLPKVAKRASLQLMLESDVLLFPVWRNRYTGGSGKMSEYCALKKFIAVSPQPQSDVINFMKYNPNARFFENSKSFIDFIKKIAAGELTPVESDTTVYTKQHNFKLLASFLKGLHER